MTVIESYSADRQNLLPDIKSLSHNYQYLSYNMSPTVLKYVENLLLPGSTVILFSGSWRFTLDATYLELKEAKDYQLPFAKSTLFLDPNNLPIFDLTMRSLHPVNIAILHSDLWVLHCPFAQMIDRMDQLLKYVQPKGQVICSVPLQHINFNRLTTTYMELGYPIVEDSMVITRT
jgi:hypothetical protein